MKLYLLTTNGCGDYYVVAKNSNDAEVKLNGLLNKADHGFLGDRTVRNINILAEEIKEFPKGKPNFCSEQRLILPNSCESKDTQVDIDISKLLSTD